MTKLLCVISLLLLSCGVVEATDFDFTLPKQYESPLPTVKILVCNADGTNCRTLCEDKMKDMMREVDGILKFNHESLNSRKPGEARVSLNLSPALYPRWSNVMKECVQ